jgi:adenylate cyclase
MSNSPLDDINQEEWRSILMGEHPEMRRGRRFFGMLPANPRCKVCNAPFRGVGGVAMKLIGREPFEKNPRFCKACLTTSEQKGVEIEISMLFADVRGSTTLAETMSPAEFTQDMNRFFGEAMKVLVRTDAWVDRLVGDEVVALFIPGFAGPEHAHQAVKAAMRMLRATGHGDRGAPWMPIGVGVHTGLAYVGLVGSEGGVSDLTAMGDSMNVAARLTELAGIGEVMVSQSAFQAAKLDSDCHDRRHLDLKGRSEPIDACVFGADSEPL